MDSYSFTGDYLTQFAESDRSTVANYFYSACRAFLGQLPTTEELITAVRASVSERCSEKRAELLAEVRRSLVTDEARAFADYVIARERLEPSERVRLKQQRSEVYRQQFMAEHPPSDKQLAFLRHLGSKETPATMAEASILIDQYQRMNQCGSAESANSPQGDI